MTGEQISRVPLASKAEVRAAVENARAAQPAWAATNPQRRAQAQFGPRYRYDHWSFDDVGRVVGGAAAAAQQGLDEASDRVRNALEARRRR
jgi:delta 1-pyrroline-5-carboxylate dehydrogenase